ncbi:MAG: hypothetical protein ACJ78J_10455 [Gemmatimonadaceae bacterium]
MAKEAKRSTEQEESGEFAEFMADISQEIAQRVESLEPPPKQPAAEKKKTPISADAGVIVEWPNVADRMIEEIR